LTDLTYKVTAIGAFSENGSRDAREVACVILYARQVSIVLDGIESLKCTDRAEPTPSNEQTLIKI
jgi:hypothetical protein